MEEKTPGAPLIEASGLYRSYGRIEAVRGVSFAVRAGEVAGFIGPNGAGKSTTLRLLTGFLRPDRGTAAIGGADVFAAPLAARRRFGYLPENGPLYGEMTPAEFLRFVGGTRGMDPLALEGDLQRARKVCHLEKVWHQTIDTLSKGYRQRVGLAQAILHDPPCLILDEPTDGLDPNQKQEVRDLIREMASTGERGILLSTHILEELEAVCDRIILIHQGRILADESLDDFRRRHPLFGGVRVAVAPDERERAAAAFRALRPFVARVEAAGPDFLLHPGEKRSLAPAVLAAARDAGLELRELAPVLPSLDDIFQQMTRPVSAFVEEIP